MIQLYYHYYLYSLYRGATVELQVRHLFLQTELINILASLETRTEVTAIRVDGGRDCNYNSDFMLHC